MSVALARRFRTDVSADGTNFVKFGAITDFAPTENPTTQAADTYDTNGFNGFEKTMTGWQNVVKALMPLTAGVPSDPGQLLAEATRFQFGDSARLYTRWYDRNGGTDAWQGRALIDWSQSKTGVADIDEITVTFKGDGVLTRITNPYLAAAIPVIVSASPAGAAVGAQITITGSGFTGLTALTIDAVAVPAGTRTILSDSVIVATIPTGATGAAAIIATNAVGASVPFAYVAA